MFVKYAVMVKTEIVVLFCYVSLLKQSKRSFRPLARSQAAIYFRRRLIEGSSSYTYIQTNKSTPPPLPPSKKKKRKEKTRLSDEFNVIIVLT